MTSSQNKIKKLFCRRCGHEWYPRSSKPPKVCPNITCHSEKYQEMVKVPKEKNPSRKFERDWSNYFKARQQEYKIATRLLNEAVKILKVKTHGNKRGRPPYPLQDKIQLCIQKVLRSTTYDAHEEFIELAYHRGYITAKPRPHSISDFMNDFQLTSILERLLVLTATPLDQLERHFSIDATGLSTPFADRWVNVRYNFGQHRTYRKMHTIVGNRTKIIVAAKVTHGTAHDSPFLDPLLGVAAEYFQIEELSGDGAYCSRKNAQAVVDIGGKPYFKIRKDTRTLSKGYPAWKQMLYDFKENKEEYEKRYHLRSNVETAYSMFKRKISSSLSSKTSTAKTNEALCLAIAHNLLVLVNSIYCLDLDVKFTS